MKNKENWLQQFFRRKPKPEEQTATVPVPQTPPEATSLPSGISIDLPELGATPPLNQGTPPAKRNHWQKPVAEKEVPTIWKVGDVIQNEYEVRGILGSGGMGVVYKVHVRSWNKDMAVKSPRPEIFTRTGGKENFIREAETWVSLGEHPHIVVCHFIMTLGSIPRIFADYVEGGNLADWIHQRRLYQGGTGRALERMLDIAIQFAWGLHTAHEQALIHQDVKPANVMLSSQGIAKVTDFGLAKARAMSSEQGEQEGEKGHQSILVSSHGMTPAYCSPEQAAGRPLSRKTDIWSWGVSVLEMFVGGVTWQSGVLAREVLASCEPQDGAIPPMPAELVKLLARCFAWQPEERPATLLEVATDLQAIYARLNGHPYPRKMPPLAKKQLVRLNNQAYSLHALGRSEEALLAFEQVIRLDPTDAYAHKNKSMILNHLGRREEALLAYEQAIRLDPTDADTHNNTGLVLHSLGRLEEALLAYEQAIRLDPTDADTYMNKGAALQALGRPEKALLACKQAIHLDPMNANNHTSKGILLDELGRPEEALLAFEQAIHLDPTDADTHNNKGIMLQALGRPEEALLAFEQAIRLDPMNANAYANKGIMLKTLGRREEALLAYEQAIRLDPTHVNAHTNKSIILKQMGRIGEAEQAYQKARVLQSKN